MPQSTPPVARDCYVRTLKGYCHRLTVFPKCTLRSFCSEMHVNYNGMKKWLSSCGLSIGSLKSRAGSFHAEVREETGDINPIFQTRSIFIRTCSCFLST